jgi:hypothetical protein
MRTHALAVERATGIDKLGAKGACNRWHGRPPWGGDAAGNCIGVNDRRTAGLQHLSHRAFTAANAAG